MKANLPKVIAVLGPTAVGKTGTAIHLAKAFNGEIISCDSVQIYKYLNIGSAKPSSIEINQVKHHLIDVFNPDYRIDVAQYKELAEAAIIDITSRGKIPFLVGGTGLYFSSLYRGLFLSPSRDDTFRSKLEERALSEGNAVLYSELAKIDPKAVETIMPNDQRRIIRAIEVFHTTGIPFSELHEHNTRLDIDWHVIGLNIERQELYNRIDRRVDIMLCDGLEDETRRIIDMFGSDAYALGSIGYRHIVKMINGEWSREEMVYHLKQDSRHYARRQLIWFRKTEGLHWHEPTDIDTLTKSIEHHLEVSNSGVSQ